ncbi:hypothetical protein PRNP1_001908 [Phytophthora ramorum]
MVQTLSLRATQDGIIWPRRPLVSSKGLLSCVQNLPLSSHDKKPARFRAVAFNVSGELLAATDERGRVFVFFVTANRYALAMHLGVPTVSCCFSPARKTELLVTCEDETVRCIDVLSQTLVSTLRGHRFPARCASFQKSGQLALTASQDAVILWDTKDWSRYRVLNAGPGVEEATFVARGGLVAVCFQDDTIMMWELESLALRYRFALPEREQSPGLKKIAVSEDHQVLVASGRAPFIYVWEFESQTIIRIIELPPPIKQVSSHAFLPGHNTMISILGDDGGIFFLDVAAKNPQIKLEIANRGSTISAFDIECHARYLAASTGDGFLLLYDMEIARETAARAQDRRRKEGLVDLVSYLPAVVYPFVKIFRENDLAAFEASVSVMLHWCGDFLVSLPYPPVFAMSAIEKELARRDAQLFDHFTQYQVTSEAFAWSLLKTIFTEVLSEDEWMCLWDHLFTFPDTPQLLFVAVLAYLSYFRTALLAACDRFSIEQFFHQQNAIDIQKFVQLMVNLRDKLDLSEFTAIENSGTREGHGPYWPLSRGQYPAFAHYPRFVVDFQISERNRIALEEAELSHKQKLFDQIEEESAKLKAEHEKWMKERKLVLEAEERRRKEAIAAEKERILHLKTLDYETRQRRLQHLSNMETSAHETLEEASKMLQTEYQRLEGTLAMQKERMEFEISSRKQEEDLQRIESETHDRVRGIHKQREMEERLSRLRTEFETRAKQQELQDLLKFESWKREDEEQARKTKIQLRQREEHALLSQERRVRQELENQLVEQQLAKDKELLELETARRARRKEQHGNDALDHEIQAEQDDGLFARERTDKSHTREQQAEDRTSLHHAREFTYREAVPRTKARKRSTVKPNRRAPGQSSDSDSEETSRRWNIPAGDDVQDNGSQQDESAPRTPDYASGKFVTHTPLQGPPSSESSMSFASASMRRTMAEMSLLEKALGNISSSESSGHNSPSVHSAEEHTRDQVDEAAASDVSFTHSDRSRQHAGGYSFRDEVRHEGQRATRVRTPPRIIPTFSEVQGDAFSTPRAAREFSHGDDEGLSTPQAARELPYAQNEVVSTPQSTREFSHVVDAAITTTTAQAARELSFGDEGEPSTPQAAREYPETRDEGVPTIHSVRELSQVENEAMFSTPQPTRASPAGEYSSQAEIAQPGGSAAVPAADPMERSNSDSEEYASSTVMDALQRPIAELEKKLGIRFDDSSDEEKEEDDEDSFDVRHDSEEDEIIEDDRAKLLQRAKRLLELSSFDTDSDDDL